MSSRGIPIHNRDIGRMHVTEDRFPGSLRILRQARKRQRYWQEGTQSCRNLMWHVMNLGFIPCQIKFSVMDVLPPTIFGDISIASMFEMITTASLFVYGCTALPVPMLYCILNS